MKRTVLVGLFLAILHNNVITISNSSVAEICQTRSDCAAFVQSVYRRHYSIKRLEFPVETLLSLLKTVPVKTPLPVFCYSHHILKKAFQCEYGYYAVCKAWRAYCSYVDIESDLFSYEIISMLVELYARVLTRGGPEKEWCAYLNRLRQKLEHHKLPFDALLNSIEKLSEQARRCDNICPEYVYTLLNEQLHQYSSAETNVCEPTTGTFCDGIVTQVRQPYDRVDFVLNTAVHTYCIRRLSGAVCALNQCDLCKRGGRIFDTEIPFYHPAICSCIQAVKESCSWEPLYEAWHQFIQYRYSGDALFIRELCILLIVIHSASHESYHARKNNDEQAAFSLPPLHDVLQLYHIISSLPLPELLTLLEVLVEQAEDIAQTYELNSTLTWRQWFIRYWWVPPVAIASGVVLWLKHALYSHQQPEDVLLW